MPGKCYFNELWLSNPDFKSWLQRVENDKFSATCSLCKNKFDICRGGIYNVKLHASGKKHKELSQPLSSFVQQTLGKNFIIKPSCAGTVNLLSVSQQPSIEREKPPRNNSEAIDSPTSNSDVNLPSVSVSPTCSSKGILNYILKDDVSKAEILWTLHKVMSHSSTRSHGDATDLFPLMFPDSTIASSMKLHKDKICYVTTFGLGPFFQKEMLQVVQQCPFLSISFDESLNDVVKKCQMDILVRYWDEQCDLVKTRYLTSCFLNKAAAVDLLSGFVGALDSLDVSLKTIQNVSMDGPNVNLKMMRELKSHVKSCGSEDDPEIFDLGTCGLHSVHNAYKTAHNSTDWKIHEFLRSLFYLFKDTPSRRADYTYHSGSSLFPHKFSAIRWVENRDTLTTAINMLKYIPKYLKGVEASPPDTLTFSRVKKAVNDPLLKAKLEFLLSVAKDLEPFLTRFQSEEPLLPFLHGELSSLLRCVGERFVQADVLKQAKTSSELLGIKIDESKNLLNFGEVHVGFGATVAVKECSKNVSELQVLLFRKECVVFLQTLFRKLSEKSPLNYKIVRGASCFSPVVMRSEVLRKQRVRVALEEFIDKKHLSPGTADTVQKVYEKLCASELESLKAWRSERLDVFLTKLMEKAGISDVCFLKFVRQILTMYHGNASVERGFSVNKECLQVGIEEKSLIAQRLVYDAIVNAGPNGIPDLQISKKMIHAVRNASSCRHEALEEKRKKDKEMETTDQLKKQVKLLQMKRKMLEELKSEEFKSLDSEIEEIKKKIKT